MNSTLLIFSHFFILGWISFGGPAAHIGYFRAHFVEKLHWLNDDEYAQLVALSQFLPGPGSSQVGFAIGYTKGGLLGAIAAFIGFTTPSILIMLGLALISQQLHETAYINAAIHGLKLLAVVVVADATLGMYRQFCQQKITISIALSSALVLLLIPNLSSQIGILLLAAMVGRFTLNKYNPATPPLPELSLKPVQWLPLVLFFCGLLLLPLFSHVSASVALFSHFFQAGSFVFGGGHVVLPLLQNSLGEQLSPDTFLSAYAAAQAVPGPMFTLATYLGAELLPTKPITGALIATLGVFLPGFLLVLAVIKNWQKWANIPSISAAMAGVNAAVVGLLIAALYTPVFTGAVFNAWDMAAVISGIYLLKVIQLPIVFLVGGFILIGHVLYQV